MITDLEVKQREKMARIVVGDENWVALIKQFNDVFRKQRLDYADRYKDLIICIAYEMIMWITRMARKNCIDNIWNFLAPKDYTE